MTSFYQEFFKSHPDPMWIFDRETLQFLDVNDAAVEDYGYSQAEFLAMSVKDIRPPEDIGRLLRRVEAGAPTGLTETDVWRHLRKDGSLVVVDVRSHAIDYKGRSAVLSTIRNVSQLLRLQQMLRNISEALYTLDHAWRFTFINRSATVLLGRPAGELLGKVAWDEYPTALGTPFEQNLRQAAETGEPVRFVDYFPSFRRWFEVRALPAEGGVAVFFQDITEQRAQREQLELLEAAVARLNDMVAIAAAPPDDLADRRFIYVNDAFLRRTGYTREETIGQKPGMLHGARTDAGELGRIEAALKEYQPVRGELARYAKNGEEYWVEMEVTPLTDPEGVRRYWITVERDITDRRRAEVALNLSEERFRTIARATSDVIWDWDLVTGRMWRNDGMQTLFGYDPATRPEGEGSWSEAVHEDDRARVVAGLHRVIDNGGTEWTDEYRLTRADGSAADVADRGTVIRDEAGRPVRMVGAMVDVTERRKLEAQLRQSQRLEAVGHLTGGIAHDFNNLLTVIIGNAELLTDELAGTPSLKRLAELTGQAAQRGAELTNRLLAFARRQTLDPKSVDPGELASDMEHLLRRTLGEQIDIEFVRGAGLWKALIDAAQLESALLNLSINARDAMPEGGRLTIETANATLDEDYAAAHADVTPGDYVMVAVSDTGQGMTPDVIARAFEPFFTTKGAGRGSGLGLSMVYGFVKQSKGHVKLYSEYGYGTTVKLYLPRASFDADDHVPPPRSTGGKGGAESILVVEDDDLVRAHVAGLLEGLGYSVTQVDSGIRGIEALRSGAPFDLLFTDVVMPGMGGRQLADAARLLRPDLPVLFTSGYTENAIVHHGRLDPGVQLLQKPYRRQDLAEKVRAVLDEAAKRDGS